MARLPRLHVSGCAQHVIQRGNHREACFYVETDYTAYLAFLKAVAVKHQVAIHAFVLMTNHVHLLLTPHPLYRRLGKTDPERQAAYRALFRGRMAEQHLAAIRDATNKAWVLGGDRFKAQIEAKTGRRPTPLGRGGDRKSAAFKEAGNQ